MHISKIYIQDNFVPNVNADQFRRKVFGVEVTLNEGDKMDDAIEYGEQQVFGYIEKNTIHTEDMRGTQVKDIQMEPLLSGRDSLIKEIQSAKTKEQLESFKLLLKDSELTVIYKKRMEELLLLNKKQN